MSRAFSENPYYREYERLLIELHKLFLAGKPEGPEADLIRDQMDIPGSYLTRPEAQRLGGLSGDLYQLEGDEYFIQLPEEEIDRFAPEIDDAASNRHWEAVLDLLRKRPASFPDDLVAELRSKAYAQLGHALPALEFARFAVTKNPQSGEAKFLELEQLCALGRPDAALARSRDYAVTTASDLWWLARLIPLLLRSNDKDTDADWSRVRDALRALLADADLTQGAPAVLTAMSKTALVLSHLALEEPISAAYWFRKLMSNPVEVAQVKPLADHLDAVLGKDDAPDVGDWRKAIQADIPLMNQISPLILGQLSGAQPLQSGVA